MDNLIIEDVKDGKLNHVIHQMNTLFTSIEKYVNDNFNNYVEIEKVTGSRLHLIINGTKCEDIMIVICKFAYILSRKFRNFTKYSNLDEIKLQFGADLGYYCDAEIFVGKENEYTSIGYPANYAAKLQSVSKIGKIYISEGLLYCYEEQDRNNFNKVNDEESKITKRKYNNGDIYSLDLIRFDDSSVFSKSIIKNFEVYVARARELSDNLNYRSMNTLRPNINFTFDTWSVRNIATFEGTVVYADIRGFTKAFMPDGSNLLELKNITLSLLNTMYARCIENKGIHVQFQGDREFVLFPYEMYEDACVFAIKLIDIIKQRGKHIGVGISYGKLYGFKIGIRGSKDNVLLGIPVIAADKLEDLYADEDCIAISETIYSKLSDNSIKTLFTYGGSIQMIKQSYYWTNIGYKEFIIKKQSLEAQKKPNMPYTKPYRRIE